MDLELWYHRLHYKLGWSVSNSPLPLPTSKLPGLAENTTGQKRQPPKQTYKAKQTQAEKGSGRVRSNSEAVVLQSLQSQFHLSGFTEAF